MNLDILFGGWLKAPNGAAAVVRSLQKHTNLFIKNGVDVSFYSLDNQYPRDFDFKNEDISACRHVRNNLKNYVKKYVNKYSRYSNVLAKKSIARGMNYSKEVALHYLQNINGKSCVLIHDLFTCYYYLSHRKTEQPTFLVLHNNGDTFSMHLEYYPCLKKTKYLDQLMRIEKYVLENVDKIIFVAEQPMKVFLKLHSYVTKDKVTFIHNGIEDDKNASKILQKHNDCIEIVTIGSVSTRKGHDIIVNALQSLSNEELTKLHITIVGDGPIKNELEQICLKKNLPITFVGFSTEVKKYLSQSDIFLLPSRDEGFPISILEAERAGIPIVSTRIAGIPEMVYHKKNGLLINPSVDELSAIFHNINEYDWKSMGQESRKLYESKFTIEDMINQYIYVISCHIMK